MTKEEAIQAMKDGKNDGYSMGAIEERFGEMINNMIVKALMSKTAAKILEKTFKLVEDAVDDGEVTQAEIEGINAEGERAVELMNTVFSGMGDWFREMLGTGGAAETLQKGIQGVTEQTAGIIEGYLNTISSIYEFK